jgi:hypothetical protein
MDKTRILQRKSTILEVFGLLVKVDGNVDFMVMAFISSCWFVEREKNHWPPDSASSKFSRSPMVLPFYTSGLFSPSPREQITPKACKIKAQNQKDFQFRLK